MRAQDGELMVGGKVVVELELGYTVLSVRRDQSPYSGWN